MSGRAPLWLSRSPGHGRSASRRVAVDLDIALVAGAELLAADSVRDGLRVLDSSLAHADLFVDHRPLLDLDALFANRHVDGLAFGLADRPVRRPPIDWV